MPARLDAQACDMSGESGAASGGARFGSASGGRGVRAGAARHRARVWRSGGEEEQDGAIDGGGEGEKKKRKRS